jgi:prepilin-type N-terminal cleavage/methylation domain-containing protein
MSGIMKKNKGLTLIEILIVIVIIAVLAGLTYFKYRDMVHKEKFVKTFSLLSIVAEAKRQQMVKTPEVAVRNQIVNGHNTITSCHSNSATRGPGYLIACNYLQQEQWEADYHSIFTCHQGQGGGCCASAPANTIACAIFFADPDNTSVRWMYHITKDGECTSTGAGAFPCLEF